MFSNSKNFINAYFNMICQQTQLLEDKKKKLIVKQVGAPIEQRPTPQEPEIGGGDIGGAEGGACCGEQIENQDATPKEAFESMLYDLIDIAYALGKKAAQDGIDYPPLEDDQIHDMLASIEATYDDGKQVSTQEVDDQPVYQFTATIGDLQNLGKTDSDMEIGDKAIFQWKQFINDFGGEIINKTLGDYTAFATVKFSLPKSKFEEMNQVILDSQSNPQKQSMLQGIFDPEEYDWTNAENPIDQLISAAQNGKFKNVQNFKKVN